MVLLETQYPNNFMMVMKEFLNLRQYLNINFNLLEWYEKQRILFK